MALNEEGVGYLLPLLVMPSASRHGGARGELVKQNLLEAGREWESKFAGGEAEARER